MSTAIDLNSLMGVLGQHLSHVKIMLEILKREHQILSKRDLIAFDKIVQEKRDHLFTLEQLEPQLAPIQALLNEHPDDKELSHFTDSIQNPALKQQFRSLWSQLRESLAQCQKQNTVNNRIILGSRANIQQALSILRGEQNVPNLYGATGKQDSGRSGHPLAVA